MTCDHSDSFAPYKWCPTCGAVYVHTPNGMAWTFPCVAGLERTEKKNLGATNEQLFPGANRTLTRSALLLDASPYSVEVVDLARELACFAQTMMSEPPCYNARELVDMALSICQHTLRTVGLTAEEDRLLQTVMRLCRRAVNERWPEDSPNTKARVAIFEAASEFLRALP